MQKYKKGKTVKFAHNNINIKRQPKQIGKPTNPVLSVMIFDLVAYCKIKNAARRMKTGKSFKRRILISTSLTLTFHTEFDNDNQTHHYLFLLNLIT